MESVKYRGLVGPNGQPISSAQFKKAPPPKLGQETFGDWAGRDIQFLTLPGGGVVQFDLSKLTLSDFRAMRDHYQINASLAVLSFMQHQSDWHIECDDQAIADDCEVKLKEIWTALNRSLSQANWSGYSPNALDWENDVHGKGVKITKIKDLYPEECVVNWKLVDGWAPPGRTPPKHKVYDGIKIFNQSWPVPVENSLWYPLLMENGDYYGRKLLRPAFQSWFFSLLLHLFANRYYERFGEPTPIGRAPWEETINPTGSGQGGEMNSSEFLLSILSTLRSRGAVVLPSDRSDTGNGTSEYDYDIQYLESQMRGADFERYMTRLDEEMSIGLFTPILLMRTADVGSYNLGVGHMQVYLWMMNALNDDRAQYINKYILNKMVNYNFSPNAPRAKIVFRKLGNQNMELIQALLTTLVANGSVKPDVRELGQVAGLTLEEVEGTIGEEEVPPTGDDDDTGDGPRGVGEPRATGEKVVARIAPQVIKAWSQGRFGPGLTLDMGYEKSMETSFAKAGFTNPRTMTKELYRRMDLWLADIIQPDVFSSPEEFVSVFKHVLNQMIEGVCRG